jgi:hypothetical protein
LCEQLTKFASELVHELEQSLTVEQADVHEECEKPGY